MRQLLLLACLALSAKALADDKVDTKELDKSSTNLSTDAASGDYNNSRSNNLDGVAQDDHEDVDGETSGTRAQDYNSSRSNTTAAKEDRESLHAEGIIHRDIAARGLKTDGGEDDGAAAEDHSDDRTTRKKPGKR